MSVTALRAVGRDTSDKDSMDKNKALDAALSQIERAFGKGSIMKLGQRDPADEGDVVSTGSLALDIALGIGGLPRGRIIEIYGPESSGKTTWRYMSLPKRRRAAAPAPSSMPSMRSTLFMPGSSA